MERGDERVNPSENVQQKKKKLNVFDFYCDCNLHPEHPGLWAATQKNPSFKKKKSPQVSASPP